MAREDGGVARPMRWPGERKAARDWARLSADRAVVKLSGELARTKAELEAAVGALDGLLDGAKVAVRIRAVLPAPTAMLEGRSPRWLARLRRNVALHSDAPGVAIDTADAPTLRQSQHGPRLEARGSVRSQGGVDACSGAVGGVGAVQDFVVQAMVKAPCSFAEQLQQQ
ncbi:unnamed protein product, partial [Prorocentrum cordatum]